jgi:hypothetical protein
MERLNGALAWSTCMEHLLPLPMHDSPDVRPCILCMLVGLTSQLESQVLLQQAATLCNGPSSHALQYPF